MTLFWSARTGTSPESGAAWPSGWASLCTGSKATGDADPTRSLSRAFWCRTQPSAQGGPRRPQRDLDRCDDPGARAQAGVERLAPPRPATRRHDLLARLHRLQARRVGGRRHDRGLPEGTHAATRAGPERREPEGASRSRAREIVERVLGLGPLPRYRYDRFVPVHSRDDASLRTGGGSGHAAGGGPAGRLREARAPGGPGSRSRRIVGLRGLRPRRTRVQQLLDRGPTSRPTATARC